MKIFADLVFLAFPFRHTQSLGVLLRPVGSMGKYATFRDADDASASARPHPQVAANCVSRLFLAWVTPLLSLGNAKQLDERDVWPLQPPHQAAVVSVAFARDFARTRSIPRAFLASFGGRFVLTGVAFFVATAATLVGPIVLNHVVAELSAGEYDVRDLATWIVALLVTQLFQALTDNYANFDSEVMAIQFTAALKNLVYRKALRLDAEARKEKSMGDITNLYTTDCDMILMAAYYVHQLWIVPLQIIAVGVLLYQLLGFASFAGFAVIALVFIINQFISTTIYNLYMEFMQSKDSRLKVVSEAFKSITIVKFNAWEDKFLARIGDARAKEVRTIWNFMKFNAMSVVLTWGLPVFISVASFSVYTTIMHQQLTPSVVFTSVALFQLVQIPLRYITDIIASIIKARVAQQRIGVFLDLPELDDNSVLTIDHPIADDYIAKNIIVAIKDASFCWEHDYPILVNINMTVEAGDFVVIHGPVGSGKSSLCSALIGDMIKMEGEVYVGGSVAYCSQQPWIQHASVRDNILFGRQFDRVKYDKVLEACALTFDLQSFPAGDRTEIGERGVNLSGGQKARIALARACYSDASVYILDAPLSAVDAIVQNEIFQKCFLGLLHNRTIIFVTHNPEIISSEHVTRAITINEEGELEETRSMRGKRPDFNSVVTPFAARKYAKKTCEEVSVLIDEDQSDENHDTRCERADVQDLTDKAIGLQSPFRQRTVSASYDDVGVGSVEKSEVTDETQRLVDDEECKEGRVGFHVFKAYYNAVGGFPILAVVLLSQALWQGLQISSDFWLSAWSTDSNVNSEVNVTASAKLEDNAAERYRIEVYTLLGLTSAFMVVIRTLTVSYFGLRAATRMFDRMTMSLMHAPIKFFDANPIGRILLRYANDVTDVDIPVPLSFGGFFANLFAVGCTLVTAAVIIQWYGLLLIPVVVLYMQIGIFYLQPAREVERVLRTSEAPILSHLSESIEGGSTIRAFGRNDVSRFQSTNNRKLDTANKIWFARLAISRWFALRIQLLGTVLVFAVAYSLVLLHNELSAAIVGLAFSYVLKVSTSVERIVQAWSSVETTMVSPERMQQYIDVEQEAPHAVPLVDPPASSHWPTSGSIRFENVSFRYKNADRLVLKNLNFSIAAGEKIGIVGRTGAGKSSLTMALFRINEIAAGAVIIDGVDVGKIGLKALRQSMSIIPQNPILFKGPLQAYLDPFDEYEDDQLWDCIRRVGLHDRVSNEEDQLECIVEENGENFSVGERQMLCMARALLRDSRIVVFDEATAAIDQETDKKLQRVIREAFDKSTVLTIAHRLDTILDSDRILVLEGGELVDFASPAEMVKKGKGHFFDLMQEGGYLDKFVGNQL